jgi:two-component system, NarL family, sensor histidine kinase UhpB
MAQLPSSIFNSPKNRYSHLFTRPLAPLNLKLRLNLITTGLLLLLMLAGIALSFNNARMNTLAEIASAEKSTLALFDSGLIGALPSSANEANVSKVNMGAFKLQQLSHMRHLKIELLDNSNRLLDSNQLASTDKLSHPAPAWFVRMLNNTMPQWQRKIRGLSYNSQPIAKLIITPDPSYEYAEIWKQMTDLLVLLALFFICVNLMIAWAIAQALKPTSSILAALDKIEKGDLDVRLPSFKLPELARIGQKFNHMIETLQKSMQKNHSLTQQLMTLQEAERKSLARDLHDEFGQCLTAINTDASVILKHAKNKYPELQASANAISDLSRHLMDLVSGLLQKLRPGVLDELGLVVALRDLVDSTQMRFGNIAFTLSENLGNTPLAEAQSLVIYRLVQESLTNIARHASATQVEISVQILSKLDNKGVEVKVSDNGKGFAPSNVEGFGLLGMRERVEGLGGDFKIETNANKGTTILAWIPLREIV